MSVALTLMFLAEAAIATCPAAGPARLGGGAKVVRPVGSLDPLPFLELGPAPDVASKRGEIQHTAAPEKPAVPKPETPAQRPCPGPSVIA